MAISGCKSVPTEKKTYLYTLHVRLVTMICVLVCSYLEMIFNIGQRARQSFDIFSRFLITMSRMALFRGNET